VGVTFLSRLEKAMDYSNNKQIQPKILKAKITQLFRGDFSRKFIFMGFKTSEIDCDKLLPGQFFLIKCRDDFSINPLLRRPFSICDVYGGVIYILVEVKGSGTEWLYDRSIGEEIEIMGPLGNGLRITEDYRQVFLVGGGIGVAPLVFAARAFRKAGVSASLLFGAFEDSCQPAWLDDEGRKVNACDLVQNGECSLSVALEEGEGECQHHGLVSELLEIELDEKLKEHINNLDILIVACGPNAMLKAIQEITVSRNISSFFMLEEMMGCGVGVCLSCACKVKTDNSTDNGYEIKHVCQDGPVFDGNCLVL